MDWNNLRSSQCFSFPLCKTEIPILPSQMHWCLEEEKLRAMWDFITLWWMEGGDIHDYSHQTSGKSLFPFSKSDVLSNKVFWHDLVGNMPIERTELLVDKLGYISVNFQVHGSGFLLFVLRPKLCPDIRCAFFKVLLFWFSGISCLLFFFFIFHISGNSFYMWRTTVKKWDLWNSFLMDTLQKLYILIICVQEIFFKGTCRTYHSFLLNFRGISKTYSLRVFFPLLYTSNINLLMHSMIYWQSPSDRY